MDHSIEDSLAGTDEGPSKSERYVSKAFSSRTSSEDMDGQASYNQGKEPR